MKMLLDKKVVSEVEKAEKKVQEKKAEPTPTPTPDQQKANAKNMMEEQMNAMKTKGGIVDKELAEALRVAQEAEKAEEEELMKRALAESA